MSNLCDVCRCLDPDCSLALRPADEWGDPIKALILDREVGEIYCSGSGGCSTCCAIFEILLDFFGEVSKEEKVYLRIYYEGASDMRLGSRRNFVQFYTPPNLPPAWDNISISPEFSVNPVSKEALNFIRECLATCSSRHPICRQPTPMLPKRLLDVSSSGRGMADIIRLVESDPGSMGRYIALSYCWGTGTTVKTIFSNLTRYKAGVAASRLPLSIQDAVHMTRLLQCRYLWVDALCIIQDSRDDWEEQSAQMASIYRNAYITLAASRAVSADEGFLTDFTPSIPRTTFGLAWSTDQGNTTILKARIMPDDDWQMHPEPLECRGWAFQERVLSTRTLIFSKEELRWSCKTSTSCECRQPKDLRLKQIHGLETAKEAYNIWQEIVNNFSERVLSHPTDKLPALSGLAEAIKAVVRSEYVAGLWKGNLLSDLAWRTASFSGEIYFEYLAPSFSWISVNSRVWHCALDAPFIEGCELVRAEVSVSGHNPYGRVTGGSIQLRGNCMPSTLCLSRSANQSLGQKKLQHHIIFNKKEISFNPDVNLEAHNFFDGHQQRSISLCRLRKTSIPRRIPPEVPISLFYLGHQKWGEAGSGCQIFLVLGISPYNHMFFERLGLLEVHYHGFAEWPEPFDDSTLATITIV